MKKLKYIVMALLFLSVSAILFYQTTRESMLVDPTLKVYVHGMENRDYWIDLLIKDESVNFERVYSGRFEDVVAKLGDYSDEEGYHAAMLSGSEGEMLGWFQGTLMKNGSFKHEFWGEGVPDEFKVIILTGDKNLIVSPAIKTKGYHSEVRFDVENTESNQEAIEGAGEIRELIPWVRILLSFFIRMGAALLIKTTVIEAFGFKLKKSTRVVIISAIVTQFVLSFALLSQIYYGAQAAFNILYIASAAILLIESVIYSLLIDEKSRKIRLTAAIVSNVAIFVAGYFLIYFVEWLSF